MTDYEIAKKVVPQSIYEIAHKLHLTDEVVIPYGYDKAKIDVTKLGELKSNGNLILVTSTSPTPYGEGKTTLTIGIHDALSKLGYSSVAVLREPSLGPVFGTKGGATGGGLSQVIPMEDINLHFTGDIHAISSANNLLCAVIDNELFHENQLGLDKETICFHRCIDMNDRALRTITTSNTDRIDHFDISTASEMMAILCLSKDMEELETRLERILVGYTYDHKPVYAKDLKCIGALKILLKDAMLPNLVQTLEHNPVLIHGGPFANIAHGCNSIIATNLGMYCADYVLTEAGFGSDMGAIKFFDIKCRMHGLTPKLVILNTTIRGLKYHGYGDLEKGLENLAYHISNMRNFTSQIMVVLNQFQSDTKEEIEILKSYCEQKEVPFTISNCYQEGSNGGISVAQKVVELCQNDLSKIPELYAVTDLLKDKIECICKKLYYADEVVYTEHAKTLLSEYQHLPLPICIAKTPYSISDNKEKLGFPKHHSMTVTDMKVNHGAGFITIYMGNTMTMPGLSKNANYKTMDIKDSMITGLF